MSSSFSNPSAKYDATRYNFFDGTKYPEDHGYKCSPTITFQISDLERKYLSKSVIDLLAILFGQTWNDRDENASNTRSTEDDEDDEVEGEGQNIRSNQKKSSFEFMKTISKATNSALNFVASNVPDSISDMYYGYNPVNDMEMEDVALKIIKENINDPNRFYKYYQRLDLKIRTLEKDCDEFKKILEYVKNSTSSTHTDFSIEVKNVFKVHKRGGYTKYKPFKESYGFSKLLWYGTDNLCVPFILINGFWQTEWESNRFGNGIYFNDCVSEAAEKIGANLCNSKGILILAEVALGQTQKLSKTRKITRSELPEGKHSVKALGKFFPDPQGHVYTSGGVQVPLGSLIAKPEDFETEFTYNEYVVYNPNQILLQYLVQVEFDFKGDD